ncbi:regulatory protein AlgP [Shigella flexneri VA-6]|nr:regulatory protein AlgP [Shigella flexneri VA-6]
MVPLRVLQAGKPVVPVAVLNALAAALARPVAKLAAGPVDAAAQTHKAVGTGVAATDEQPHAPER